MKKLNLKMHGIGEMLSKEQMKNVVGGYGCPVKLGQACLTIEPAAGQSTVSGICSDSPSGPCKCKVFVHPNSTYYNTPLPGYCNN